MTRGSISLGRRLRRYRRANGGVTAIEFGLVGAPFIWLLCVVFETGLMLFAEYTIENGTAQAGRLIRTGQVQSQGISQGRFRELVCGSLGKVLDCKNRLHVDVRSFPNFQSIELPPSSNGGELSPEVTTGAQFQPGNPLEVVVVRVLYDWKLFTPGISLLANLAKDRRVLSAATAFRNEPFPTEQPGALPQ
jgi:Flp pilus assembly protein TadG